MRAIWINKGSWKKPGPVSYMGLLNALSFAWNGISTDFFVNGPADADIKNDLADFYGLEAHPKLNIHLSPKSKGFQRPVYKAALDAICRHSSQGEQVLVLTREVGILPALIKLKKRYPALKVLHEVHDYYGSVKHLPSRSLSDYRRMLSERLCFAGLDGLICLTEYQRALYQQWLPNLPMTVQPLGSARPNQSLPGDYEPRRSKRRLAYIGHLHSYKGLNLILALAKELQGKQVEIVCYGGHEKQVAELRQLAEKEQLANTLSFVPFLSPVQLNEVLANDISIGLVPLQDTYYSRYLTCPVKALDFMANALPIVGSDVPCVKDVAGQAGQIVNASSAEDYASSICTLLDDKALYTSMAQKAAERATTLSWQSRAMAISQFSEQL